eukprot:2728185-Prymnesium_polylepis.1
MLGALRPAPARLVGPQAPRSTCHAARCACDDRFGRLMRDCGSGRVSESVDSAIDSAPPAPALRGRRLPAPF